MDFVDPVSIYLDFKALKLSLNIVLPITQYLILIKVPLIDIKLSKSSMSFNFLYNF